MQDRTVAEHARLVLIEIGYQSLKGVCDFRGVGPLEADLEAVALSGPDVAGQVKERPEHAEHVFGGPIVLVEAEGGQPLGVVGRELERADDEAAILTQQRSRLADGGRVDLAGRRLG